MPCWAPPLWLSLLAVTTLGAAQALVLAAGLAPYTRYLDRVPMTALVTCSGSGAAGVDGRHWRRQRPFSPATRVVLAYSAAALYLLLLALLHPSKAVVDALFHAHRLEAVRAGHYFFTQPMPDGVAFPYAIALYVVSLPWMAVTRDHVALLRIVVCTAHVLTGLLLYAAVVGRWQDRLTGVLAVVLWSLVPQWFVVVGNANLTAAFGQSTATATLLVAAVLALGPRDYLQVAAVFVLASVAFLSHVGTFPLLFVALMLLAAASFWRGDRAERTPARWIAAVAVVAAIVSVVTYYGHFAAVYKSLDRVTGRSTAAAPATPVEESTAEPTSAARPGNPTPAVPARAATAAMLTLRAVGWPVAILWMVGAWRLLTGRPRDRLTTTLLAWFVMCAGFVAFTVVTPVEPRFYRYNVEFIGRVVYATWPAVIIVAASGGAWLWRSGQAGRAVVRLAGRRRRVDGHSQLVELDRLIGGRYARADDGDAAVDSAAPAADGIALRPQDAGDPAGRSQPGTRAPTATCCAAPADWRPAWPASASSQAIASPRSAGTTRATSRRTTACQRRAPCCTR